MEDGIHVDQLRDIELADADFVLATVKSQFVQVWQPDVIGGIVPQISIAHKLVLEDGNRVLGIHFLDFRWEALV